MAGGTPLKLVTTFGIIGAGIVGLATARRLLMEFPDSHVWVLEKEPHIALHQTGHNSGVVHAGIYYKPGSEKSRLCRRGVGLLRDFCQEAGVPYEECGKLVVAKTPDEIEGLERLYERGVAAGVPGLELLGPSGIGDFEPHVVGHAALHSPTTAIVDFTAVADALSADVRARGGEIVTGVEVNVIRETSGAVVVGTARDTRTADWVVICAGLQADRLSRAAGGDADPKILPFRGEYFQLRSHRRGLIRALVYPVPDPRYPFLGVHFTRRISGEIDVGPNAILALAREGYRWRDVTAKDVAEILAWPGSWRMARTHWRTGVREVAESLSLRRYARQARLYVPELERSDLVRRAAGVRAQAVDRTGRLLDDFVLQRHGRILSVRNAPSPAATSSLAIGERLVALAKGAAAA
jgi:(S)-2-hydroxyglutarate dehydrogenase